MDKYITINNFKWDVEISFGEIHHKERNGEYTVVGKETADGNWEFRAFCNGQPFGSEPHESSDDAIEYVECRIEDMIEHALKNGSREQIGTDMVFAGEILKHLEGVGCYYIDDVKRMLGDWVKELAEKYGVSNEEADRLIIANMAEMGTLKETYDDEEE